MKKNLFYVVILAALCVAVYFFVFKNSNSTIALEEKNFAVEDTAAIDKIAITDMSGEKILLERTPGGWWANEKYPVRKDAISLLLSTIKSLSVKYPVSESANNNVIKDMAANNKKVEIYDSKNKLLCAYYIGGPTPDNSANYMKTGEGTKAFAVCIPGFTGTVEVRYITDENEMRSRTIFDFPLDAIKQVKVEYTESSDSSFAINVAGIDSFILIHLKDNTAINPKLINKDMIGAYLSLFKFINAEGYENQNKQKDTILLRKPFCVITLTDINNAEHAVQCYYKPVSKTSLQQYNSMGLPLQYDTDHYFATINEGKDFVLIQQFHFGRLFKNISFFMNKTKSKK